MKISFAKPQLILSLLLLFLFLVALIPRIYRLSDSEIYPDEVTWTVRSKEVFNNLRGGNFTYFQSAWWNKKEDTEAIAIPLTFIGGLSLRFFGQTVSHHSFKLLSDIDAVRLPVVVLSSLFIVVFFYYLRQIIDSKIAFAVALLLALDPNMLALSRWALNDALLTIFSATGLISYIANVKEKKISPFPGIFLALAFLTKPNGILPIIAWLIISLLNRDKKAVKLLLVNLVVAASLIYLLWPSMYTNPLYIVDYFIRQTQLTQSDFRNYFLGVVTNNPPFYYYLFQIGTRIPSLIVVGLLLGILFMAAKVTNLKNIKRILLEHSAWFAVVIYSIIFYLVISIASKKLGARYILPLWPWIYLASIIVWFKIFKFNKIVLDVFIAVLFLSSSYTLFNYTPQLYFYYNSLIGGSKNAQNYDLPNLCLGVKSASTFVNNYPDVTKITYLGCGASIFPYYSNKQITTNLKDKSDLVVVEDSYQRLLPNEDFIESFNLRKPLTIISEKGIILAKIYSNLNKPTKNKSSGYTLVFVGDSMTEYLGNFDELQNYLKKYYPDNKFLLLNYGFGSTNILSVQDRLEKDSTHSGRIFQAMNNIPFDLILIESFGHNPLSEYPLNKGLRKQTEALDKIISTLRQKHSESTIVFIATIAPNSENYGYGAVSLLPEQRKQWVEERVAYIKNHIEYAKSKNIPLINIYQESLKDGTGNIDYISSKDSIHPSSTGIYFISEQIADFIGKLRLDNYYINKIY